MNGILQIRNLTYTRITTRAQWVKWVFLRTLDHKCRVLSQKLNKHLLKSEKQEKCN